MVKCPGKGIITRNSMKQEKNEFMFPCSSFKSYCSNSYYWQNLMEFQWANSMQSPGSSLIEQGIEDKLESEG